MTPFAGTLLQILRGFMLIAWVVMAGLTVFTPDQVDGNLAWTTAVVLAVYIVTFGWRLMSARLGMNRCYLLAGGVAVTNRFGQVTDFVAWSDVTGIQQTTVVELYMGAHRLEISRNGTVKPLTLLAGCDVTTGGSTAHRGPPRRRLAVTGIRAPGRGKRLWPTPIHLARSRRLRSAHDPAPHLSRLCTPPAGVLGQWAAGLRRSTLPPRRRSSLSPIAGTRR
ncbi:hypothetical protein ACWENA_21515 [Streptomyces sp. NPDC004779]